MIDRIQARSIRRAGELLDAIPPAPGKRTDLEPGMGALTRSQAAAEAGMSLHQMRTAARVATVPAAEFDTLVKSAKPPTVTALAELGTVRRPEPPIIRGLELSASA